MSLVQAEILTTFKHHGQTFEAGEVRKVTPQELDYFCRAGWAKDPTGAIQTQQPGPTDVVLEVADIQQSTENKVV